MRLHTISAIRSGAIATSIFAFFVLFVEFPAPAGEIRGSGGVNAPDVRDRPILILVSIDGFGWDYLSMYDTPSLDRLAAAGVRAEAMRPVFPSLTFPNHYSIATGRYPADHGIVANSFPDESRREWYHLWDRDSVQDARWYGGEPIWVTAENNGLVSAAYYFVGTEAAVGGVSPTYWNAYDESVQGSSRVGQVIDWLRLPPRLRPHVITLYFEDVDKAGHARGRGSQQLADAVAAVDGNIGHLLDALESLALRDSSYVIVVSDHGQAGYVDRTDVLVLDEQIDVTGLDIVDGGSYAWLYQLRRDRRQAEAIRDAINAHWTHGRAVLREDAPADWHVSDSPRYPEIFVVPDLGYGVVATRDNLFKINRGDHGWDPAYREMHGIFLAAGPRLPAATTIGEISALDVQPLMQALLGLESGATDAGPLVRLVEADD